jgi:DNA-binding transcriptional LysR family regulator
MLNLHKLDLFLVVARTGNLSRAAEALFLTQAAVSQHVRGLEQQLGTPLFNRQARGVTLTEAGRVLLQYAQQISALAAEAERAVTALGTAPAGTLQIGVTPAAAAHLIPQWLAGFQARHEGVKVALHTRTTPVLVADVLAGRLDLAVVEGEISGHVRLHVVELQDAELCVALDAGHPWRERNRVSIRELVSQRLIARPPDSQTRIWMDDLFRRFGLTPHVVAEFDDPQAIINAVASGMGISILPACMVQPRIAEGDLASISLQEFPVLRRPLKLIWRGDDSVNPITQAFIADLSGRFPHLQAAISQ